MMKELILPTKNGNDHQEKPTLTTLIRFLAYLLAFESWTIRFTGFR